MSERQSRSYTLSQTTIDLGRLRMGESKGFTVELLNHTRETLPFVGFQTSCSCSNLKVSEKQIPAQGKASIEGQFRAQQVYGLFRREIRVQCQGKDEPAILTLTGEIFREICIEPEALTLKPDALAGKGDSGQVLLQNRSSQPVRFKFQTQHEDVKVELIPPEIPPGQTGVLKVSAAGTFLTVQQIDLVAATSHPSETVMRIPLRIAPQSPLKVHPPVYNWGVIDKGEWRKLFPLEVRLLGPTLEAYRIQKIELPGYLVWTNPSSHQKSKDQAHYQISLKPGATPPVDLNSFILFTLQHKTNSNTCQLRIPMSGLLRDRQKQEVER